MNVMQEVIRDYENGYTGVDCRMPRSVDVPDGEYNIYWVESASDENVEWGVLRNRKSGRFLCSCKGFTTRGYCRHAEESLRMFREDGPYNSWDIRYSAEEDPVVPVRLNAIKIAADQIDSKQSKIDSLIAANEALANRKPEELHKGFDGRNEEVVYEAPLKFTSMHTLRVATHRDWKGDEMIGFEVGGGDLGSICRFVDREQARLIRDQINKYLGIELELKPDGEDGNVEVTGLDFPDSVPADIQDILTKLNKFDPDIVQRVIAVTREMDAAQADVDAAAELIKKPNLSFDEISACIDAIGRVDAAAAEAAKLGTELLNKSLGLTPR